MKIHEYQAKELMGAYGIPVPGGSVAETPEEADDFLEMMFAVVVRGRRSVRRYFEEAGVDMTGANEKHILF